MKNRLTGNGNYEKSVCVWNLMRSYKNSENRRGLHRKNGKRYCLYPELLNNMIEKIVIHEAIKHDGGFREQKIEIYYRFVGKID